MVFENLTLFEVHFEDASFGPALPECHGDSATGDDAEPEDEATEDGGLPVGRLLLASLLVSLIVSIIAWKLGGDDEPDVDIDAPDEPVDVSIDD